MISADHIASVEEDTREQSRPELWIQLRTGRITASKVKSVCSSPLHPPSFSLIKSICYPEVSKFTSAATKWGSYNEKDALLEYIERQSEKHKEFSVCKSMWPVP